MFVFFGFTGMVSSVSVAASIFDCSSSVSAFHCACKSASCCWTLSADSAAPVHVLALLVRHARPPRRRAHRSEGGAADRLASEKRAEDRSPRRQHGRQRLLVHLVLLAFLAPAGLASAASSQSLQLGRVLQSQLFDGGVALLVRLLADA